MSFLDKIQWHVTPKHDLSRFAKLLKNENSLESFIVIFDNSSPKGFSGQKIKKSIKSLLSADS